MANIQLDHPGSELAHLDGQLVTRLARCSNQHSRHRDLSRRSARRSALCHASWITPIQRFTRPRAYRLRQNVSPNPLERYYGMIKPMRTSTSEHHLRTATRNARRSMQRRFMVSCKPPSLCLSPADQCRLAEVDHGSRAPGDSGAAKSRTTGGYISSGKSSSGLPDSYDSTLLNVDSDR